MSTTEAAQREHDHALGKRGCYHLFRLPISIEDRLRATAFDEQLPPSQDEALKALSTLADGGVKAPTGPVQIGIEKEFSHQKQSGRWRPIITQHSCRGFDAIPISKLRTHEC